MTVLISTHQHPADLSVMSDQDYVSYQRELDDELIERYYARGFTPPGMTPVPGTVAEIEPPF